MRLGQTMRAAEAVANMQPWKFAMVADVQLLKICNAAMGAQVCLFANLFLRASYIIKIY